MDVKLSSRLSSKAEAHGQRLSRSCSRNALVPTTLAALSRRFTHEDAQPTIEPLDSLSERATSARTSSGKCATSQFCSTLPRNTTFGEPLSIEKGFRRNAPSSHFWNTSVSTKMFLWTVARASKRWQRLHQICRGRRVCKRSGSQSLACGTLGQSRCPSVIGWAVALTRIARLAQRQRQSLTLWCMRQHSCITTGRKFCLHGATSWSTKE